MNASQMIELMNRRPFKPIEIRLNDGSSILVEQPFHVSTARNSSSCVIHDEDKARFVAYRNMTEVVTEDAQANGS